MASVSGFDPLFDAMCKNPALQMESFFIPISSRNLIIGGMKAAWNKILLRFFGLKKGEEPNPFVKDVHAIAAARVTRHANKKSNHLIFLSVGENQFAQKFLKASLSLRKRIIITLHQPPSWLEENFRDIKVLDDLALIICLSKEQLKFVSRVCNTPAVFIRHGVCHDFFYPPEIVPGIRKQKLIFVGNWYRDFKTLEKALPIIWGRMPDVEIDCVLQRSVLKRQPEMSKLYGDRRVRFQHDIPVEKMRCLYQNASLLFLPLLDAAANNTIVEAMASGLPVVSTRVGGVPDYVPEGAGELCSIGNAKEHANAVCNLLSDPEKRKAAGLVARKFCEKELDWNVISERMLVSLERFINS